MCGKFHTPLRMVHILEAIFGGLVPNSKNIDRQTDRQTDEFLDTIYGWVCVFFSIQNFLPPYSLRSQGDNSHLKKTIDDVLTCLEWVVSFSRNKITFRKNEQFHSGFV